MRTVRVTDAVYKRLLERKRGNMTFDSVIRGALRDAYTIGMSFEDEEGEQFAGRLAHDRK